MGVVHTFISSTLEAEAGKSLWVWDGFSLESECGNSKDYIERSCIKTTAKFIYNILYNVYLYSNKYFYVFVPYKYLPEGLYVLQMCAVPAGTRRGHCIPWNKSYGWLWISMWVLEIKTKSPGLVQCSKLLNGLSSSLALRSYTNLSHFTFLRKEHTLYIYLFTYLCNFDFIYTCWAINSPLNTVTLKYCAISIAGFFFLLLLFRWRHSHSLHEVFFDPWIT